MTELELWTQFKDGDQKAYAHLYKVFSRDLYSYGLHFTSNKDIIEDAIHDLFVSLFQNRTRLPKVDSVKGYLFTSLRNELFRVFRKDKLVFQFDVVELESSLITYEESVEDNLIQEEIVSNKRNFIEQLEKCLSPREKEAIYHRYTHQLSINSIAELMGINQQSAKNLIYTSIQKMRKESAIPFLVYFATFIS